jgi:AGCS family alanine or glycine:cation symporter
MVALYLLAGAYVLIMSADQIPGMLALIFRSAFSPQEFSGAFLGGTVGYAFLFGMKRALFSNEAGQGSSPIAHSAAKTNEPVREALVAGLEPFIDTLIVCTFTALVILSTGIWNRAPEASYAAPPAVVSVGANEWSLETLPVPQRVGDQWANGDAVFIVLSAGPNPQSGNNLHHLDGVIVEQSGALVIEWVSLTSTVRPQVDRPGIYASYVGATLTAKAFDSVTPGLGKWLVTLAVWLFAFSTMISWSYYGEQGIVFLFGERMVLAYKVIYCGLIIVATWGFIETDADLDNLTGVGTGVMLFVNIPIMWLFGRQAMRAYHDYVARLKAGQMGPGHPPPSIENLISGRDGR